MRPCQTRSRRTGSRHGRPLSVSFVLSPQTHLSSYESILFIPLLPGHLQCCSPGLQEPNGESGTCLFDHPFTKCLQECDSVDSITAILHSQAQTFRVSRDDGKLMNPHMFN